jgi:hypothetical protein
MAEFHLAEFDRKPLDQHSLWGFVLGWSQKLTLLHVVSDHLFELNGYCVLKNSEVRRWRVAEPDSLMVRALETKRIRPKPLASISYEDWPSVLRTAGAAYPLLTIYRERIKKDACHIGRLSTVDSRSFVLNEIDSSACWDDEPCRYKFSDLTLVQFGGRYEDALYRVALADAAKSKSPVRLNCKKKSS